jgi:glycerate-2-kinase
MDKINAEKIFYAALNAVNPYNAVANSIRIEDSTLIVGEEDSPSDSYDLSRFKQINIVGCGKAAWPMCLAIEKVAGKHIGRGLVVTKYNHVSDPYPSKIEIREAAHPYPDRSGYDATVQTARILESSGKDDLVIALISGGGSSLWALPVSPINLEEFRETTRELVGCGADIKEINCVRKHLSAISGGLAAFKAYPARVIVLVISDVIGDYLDTIGSGPFFPDETTFEDALKVLEKYDLSGKIPAIVNTYLEQGYLGLYPETPKRESICFKNVSHKIIASNRSALEAARRCAEELGFSTIVIKEPTCGEAKEAARFFCNKVKEISKRVNSDKLCVIAGGETTVTLGNKSGIGGRNQEFALAAALEIERMDGITILSCGTDGTDGPTDANGAIVDGKTVELCRKAGLNLTEALEKHDSYTLFNNSGNLMKTGPTYTNVMDLQIAIIEKQCDPD